MVAGEPNEKIGLLQHLAYSTATFVAPLGVVFERGKLKRTESDLILVCLCASIDRFAAVVSEHLAEFVAHQLRTRSSATAAE